MTTTPVTFEPLPPPTGVRRRTAELLNVAAQLNACPGEWAHISTHPTRTAAASQALHIRRGSLAAFRPVGAFAATQRTVEGEFRVYACRISAEQIAANAVPPAPVLSAAQRKFLAFALELAGDAILDNPEDFTADDDAALASLRKLAGGEQA